MTDKEIIKVLEYCTTDGYCMTCPYNKCADKEINELALDLINRQQAQLADERAKIEICAETISRQDAEVEELKVENKKLNRMVEAIDDYINPLPFKTDFDNAIENAKSEAVKEFAERLKNDLFYKCGDLNYTETCDTRRLIDNLVKEMVGE